MVGCPAKSISRVGVKTFTLLTQFGLFAFITKAVSARLSWLSVYMKTDALLRLAGNAKRLQILEWLNDPRAHFPPQVDGDLDKDGVCAF